MKKSTKILAIVLALALVLGMLTLGIAAASGYDYAAAIKQGVAGESIPHAQNFEGASVGAVLPAEGRTDAYIYRSAGSYSTGVIYKGAMRANIVQENGNKYFQVLWTRQTQAVPILPCLPVSPSPATVVVSVIQVNSSHSVTTSTPCLILTFTSPITT